MANNLNGQTFLSKQHQATLAKFLGFSAIQLKLLYKASRTSAPNAQQCHNAINNMGATISVARTNNNHIFGGYTSLSWTSQGGYKNDPKAFLFKLIAGSAEGHKLSVKPANVGNSIYDEANHGPAFGGGHDLLFFSGGGNFNNGYSALGSTYEAPPNQNAQTFLAGSYNGWVIEEFEVLQVTEGCALWRKVTFSPQNCDALRAKLRQHKYSNAKPLDVVTPNVALFGVPGTGKSSSLNTLISSLKGGQPSTAQVVRTDADTVTLRLSSFPLFPEAPLCVWDTMGMKEHSYEGGELDYILLGHVKPNSKLTDAITPRSECYRANATFAQQAHCVVLVISAQNAENSTTITRLKKVRNAANRLDNIPVLIAVTQIDLYEPGLETLPDCELLPKVYENARIKLLFETIKTAFGVNMNDIYPIRNYHSELEVNPNVDTLALTFLQRVVQVCDDFFLRNNLAATNNND